MIRHRPTFFILNSPGTVDITGGVELFNVFKALRKKDWSGRVEFDQKRKGKNKEIKFRIEQQRFLERYNRGLLKKRSNAEKRAHFGFF